MEENNLNKYLAVMHKIIKSANPKYMSYVSKEYMKYSSSSPVICEAIRSMITTEVKKNQQSPYAIFLDSDGTINLEAINDISKITNLPQFISQVQELAKYNVDFSNMSAEDLIKEGDQIAREIEQELESEMDKAESKEDIDKLTNKASTGLVKLGILATIAGAVGSSISRTIERIKTKLTDFRNKKSKLEDNNDEKSINSQEAKMQATPKVDKDDTFKSVCPPVYINEAEVLRKMHEEKSSDKEKAKLADTYGDGDPDGDDLNI